MSGFWCLDACSAHFPPTLLMSWLRMNGQGLIEWFLGKKGRNDWSNASERHPSFIASSGTLAGQQAEQSSHIGKTTKKSLEKFLEKAVQKKISLKELPKQHRGHRIASMIDFQWAEKSSHVAEKSLNLWETSPEESLSERTPNKQYTCNICKEIKTIRSEWKSKKGQWVIAQRNIKNSFPTIIWHFGFCDKTHVHLFQTLHSQVTKTNVKLTLDW